MPSRTTLRAAWKKLERSGQDPVQKLRKIGTHHEQILLTYIDEARSNRGLKTASTTAKGATDGPTVDDSDFEMKIAAFFEVVLDSEDFKDFTIELRTAAKASNKSTYRVVFPSAASWFAYNQIDSQLRSELQTTFSNRNTVADLVGDSTYWQFKRLLVRADIENFYESISHNSLMARIEADQNISSTSIRAIKSLLRSYTRETNRNSGIPRGVSMSATIAEYVLADFDQAIRGRNDCLLYVRYVDDIYAVFQSGSSPQSLQAFFSDGLAPLGLHLSSKPSKRRFDLVDISKTPSALEYLGYKFKFGMKPGEPNILLSAERRKRLASRIVKSFEIYSHSSKSEWEKAVLLDRIRFLTSNTKLTGNKRDAYVGIRFSQRALTGLEDMDYLDKQIKTEADKLNDADLANRLVRFKCREGFEHSKFHTWSPHRLKTLGIAWRDQ
ncbi:RNA-directed DNA polymerase [Paenarthrobacter sp. OM7]|uniref:antiviral reverse transcriptase Drt3a n=1 Tax=Paenarthrobacter sp. OM7 TaxID=3041264 RepID=UPI0024683847|nr:antiviral reverse transcriptase Drt3a [Paenarthrobacter sp. OM7]WGM21721.1 RNA-directed DNA polymerase [Paenarthrobacter sp. OM7]